MRMNQAWRKLAAAGLLAAGGCSVGPDYKTPDMKPPSQFSEIAAATQPTTEPSTAQAIPEDYQLWWTTFNDPTLNSLIARAIKNNPDIQAAEARLYEARADRGAAASAYYPEIDANGSYEHSRQSSNTAAAQSFGAAGGTGDFPGQESDLWNAGFDATWEVDIFGGTRRAVEAADAGIQAAEQDRRDVLVSLTAEVAVNYIQLRGSQYELAISRDNLNSQQQTLDLTRSKADAGLIPYLDVAQQQAQVATTAADIPTLEAQIRMDIHHLGILLGLSPGALSDELTPQAKIPDGPAFVPPGLPGDLLLRRPDVRRAERQLAAATANIGVATADLYPKFSITGALGVEAEDFQKLFRYTSRTYDILPGVTWDIFDAGRVKSNIQVQNARQAEALAAYIKAVLQSMQDVDDSLVNYNREQVRRQSLREAVTANQKAVELSMDLFNHGSTDFLSVLDAQRSLFAAQVSLAQSEQQVSADLVSLYKALGGGWQQQ